MLTLILAAVLLSSNLLASARVVNRTLELHEDYHVSWIADLEQKNITFEVVVRTNGFVGFGLSPQGGMSEADIVIGGVENGKPYFSDRFGTGKKEPEVDKSEDWTLLDASEDGPYTTLKFSRSLDTCDEAQDLPINNDTTNFIWAYGTSDKIEYHTGNRGVQAVNILDELRAAVDTSNFTGWDMSVHSELPNDTDTDYACTIHKVSAELMKDRRHIVGFSVKLENNESLQHNHHMVLHKCSPNGNQAVIDELEGLVGKPGIACYSGKMLQMLEHCGTYMYIWAKGGEPLFLPEDIGLPLQDENSLDANAYFILEIHHDNPGLIQGLTYDTGMTVFTTDHLRAKEAGVLIVGPKVNPSLLVPPKTSDFIIVGHCSPGCTEENFPPEGINIFNILLHAHLAGQKLKLRHFRNGTELPWVSYDNNYDFNYQQNRPLPVNAVILPGDQLTYECTYSSLDRDPPSAVIGGQTTRTEMCEAIIMYEKILPQLARCGSTYPVQAILDKIGKAVGVEEWSDTRGNPTVTKPASLANLTYTDVLNTKVVWTADLISELQQALRYDDHQVECASRLEIEGRAGEAMINYPKNYSAYVPEQKKCDGGDGGGAAAIVPATLIATLFLAFTQSIL